MNFEVLSDAIEILEGKQSLVDVTVYLPGGCMFVDGGKLTRKHFEDLDETRAMIERNHSFSEAMSETDTFRTTPIVVREIESGLRTVDREIAARNGNPRGDLYREIREYLEEVRDKVAKRVVPIDEKHKACLMDLAKRFKLKASERSLELLQQAFLSSEPVSVLTFNEGFLNALDLCSAIYGHPDSPMERDSNVILCMLSRNGIQNYHPRKPEVSFRSLFGKREDRALDAITESWARYVR